MSTAKNTAKTWFKANGFSEDAMGFWSNEKYSASFDLSFDGVVARNSQLLIDKKFMVSEDSSKLEVLTMMRKAIKEL